MTWRIRISPLAHSDGTVAFLVLQVIEYARVRGVFERIALVEMNATGGVLGVGGADDANCLSAPQVWNMIWHTS